MSSARAADTFCPECKAHWSTYAVYSDEIESRRHMRCPKGHRWETFYKFESWNQKGFRLYRRVRS